MCSFLHIKSYSAVAHQKIVIVHHVLLSPSLVDHDVIDHDVIDHRRVRSPGEVQVYFLQFVAEPGIHDAQLVNSTKLEELLASFVH